MGLMDRIKKVTGSNDTYDDAYDDDYYDGFGDAYDDNMDDGDVTSFQANPAPAPGPAAAAPAGMGIPSMGNVNAAPAGDLNLSGANIKMQVVHPVTYDSDTASQIANHLLNKCTVVLNLEKTNKETSRRLIDFLTGVAYSIGGNLKQVATNAYVITPSNVDVGDAQIKRTARRTPEPEAEAADQNEFNDFTA